MINVFGYTEIISCLKIPNLVLKEANIKADDIYQVIYVGWCALSFNDFFEKLPMYIHRVSKIIIIKKGAKSPYQERKRFFNCLNALFERLDKGEVSNQGHLSFEVKKLPREYKRDFINDKKYTLFNHFVILDGRFHSVCLDNELIILGSGAVSIYATDHDPIRIELENEILKLSHPFPTGSDVD